VTGAGARKRFDMRTTSNSMEASSPVERQSSRSSDSNLASQARTTSSRITSLHHRTISPP
jgi:hypothetical protein